MTKQIPKFVLLGPNLPLGGMAQITQQLGVGTL